MKLRRKGDGLRGAAARALRSARGSGRAVLLLAAVAVAAACDRGNADVQPAGEPTDVSYAPELNVDLDQMVRTPSGLYIRELEAGTGEEAIPPSWVTVHYTGYFPNGEAFDTSRDGEPFQFLLGAADVIPGWEEGVAGMREGGRRQLVIPPGLAYGEEGAGGGVIPPNVTLVFDVEMVSVD